MKQFFPKGALGTLKAVLVLLLIIGFKVDSAVAAHYSGTVDRVVDGDTIVIDGTKVRLIGIDTPETHHPKKPIQCYGKEATAFTRTMLEGKRVTYVTDEKYPTRDKYGRLLAYVHVGKQFFNAEAIKQGYAFVYTQFPFKYSSRFIKLEEKAKKYQNGLWGVCTVNCSNKVCSTNSL